MHPRQRQGQRQHLDSHRRPYPQSYPQQQQQQTNAGQNTTYSSEHQFRPTFLSQPVYQLACAACLHPLCVRAMKAVMLSDHSKELYSTDMPPVGLQLVNEDRQVRHCSCRIRDGACLGCGQIVEYHVTQPCSGCLNDQNNGHFWMFYSSSVYHYKRNCIGKQRHSQCQLGQCH
ncbi:MAG: FAM72 protein-domain-containing protein [Benniella sp.]|nr:MAG: FAM72 protein-domain-containing protein [Benniella sp.]